MSEANPYTPATSLSANDFGIQKVKVRPIELMKRGHALIADRYWQFLGITVLGVLVGSAVPMGIIFGAMVVGIYLCYIYKEQGLKVEVGTLFKGFEYFMESFVVWIVLFLVSMVVMLPFMIGMFAMIWLPIIQNAGNQANPPQFPIGAFLVMYPLMLLANVVITLPFLFAFQLIADRNVKGLTAVKLSFYGVRKNFFGVFWFIVVLYFVSFLLAMMCYIPAFLFMPISFGAMYLLYRDIYGPGMQFTGGNDRQQTPPPVGMPEGA